MEPEIYNKKPDWEEHFKGITEAWFLEFTALDSDKMRRKRRKFYLINYDALVWILENCSFEEYSEEKKQALFLSEISEVRVLLASRSERCLYLLDGKPLN